MTKIAQKNKQPTSINDEIAANERIPYNYLNNMLKFTNKPSFSVLSTAGSAAADVALSISSSISEHIAATLKTFHEAGEVYASSAKSQTDTTMALLSLCLNSGVSLATNASEEFMSATEAFYESIATGSLVTSKSDK